MSQLQGDECAGGSLSKDVFVDQLLSHLRSDDARNRQEAIGDLLKTPAATVAHVPLTVLLETLDDADSGIRIVVVSALGKKGDTAALPALMKLLLNDSHPTVRSKAARALADIGNSEAIVALLPALFGDVDEVASEAGLAIRKLGGPKAVAILIGALAKPSLSARRSAAMQLKGMTDPALLPALLVALTDSDIAVRRLSAIGLGNLNDPRAVPALRNVLGDHDPSVRLAVLAALVRILGASAMPALLTCWNDSDADVHRTAWQAMQKLASKAEVPFLLRALCDNRATHRADAAAILGEIRSRETISDLRAALKDKDSNVRLHVLGALAAILQGPEAVSDLIGAIQDEDSRVRRHAVDALAAIGAPSASPGLVSALKNPDRLVRYAAAKTLGASEYSGAVLDLVAALKDPDALVRATAARALGDIADPVALEGVETLLSDQAPVPSEPGVLHEPGPSHRVSAEAKKASAKLKVAQALKTIHFTPCYPKEVDPNAWHSAYVYIFGINAADLVAADARALLGERIDQYRTEGEAVRAKLRDKMSITVTPRMDGFEFNPERSVVDFCELWHRVDFRLRATEKYLRKTSNGTVTITLNGVVVADIPISIYVQAKSGSELGVKSPIRESWPEPYVPYQSIFCSYSHQDAAIAKRVERVCRSLGMTYLRDSVTLKSGENWSVELLAMIERADVFQLFWSQNAAASSFVEKEWRHAQKLGRAAKRFIRPVYWTEPMPPPPPELAHLHFAFAPEL
jgi:HEAT repeat protein